jgi:hypothetical protein
VHQDFLNLPLLLFQLTKQGWEWVMMFSIWAASKQGSNSTLQVKNKLWEGAAVEVGICAGMEQVCT